MGQAGGAGSGALPHHCEFLGSFPRLSGRHRLRPKHLAERMLHGAQQWGRSGGCPSPWHRCYKHFTPTTSLGLHGLQRWHHSLPLTDGATESESQSHMPKPAPPPAKTHCPASGGISLFKEEKRETFCNCKIQRTVLAVKTTENTRKTYRNAIGFK